MIFRKFSKISNRVRIATGGSQHEVLLFACLYRKSEKASISQYAANSVKYARKVSDVNKYIGCDRKIETLGLHLQELD